MRSGTPLPRGQDWLIEAISLFYVVEKLGVCEPFVDQSAIRLLGVEIENLIDNINKQNSELKYIAETPLPELEKVLLDASKKQQLLSQTLSANQLKRYLKNNPELKSKLNILSLFKRVYVFHGTCGNLIREMTQQDFIFITYKELLLVSGLDKIKRKGGLYIAKPLSLFVTSIQELKDYLISFERDIASKVNFAIILKLKTMDHAIKIFFHPLSKTWYLTEPNALGIEPIKYHKDLATHIMEGLLFKEIQPHQKSKLCFSTEAMIAKENKKHFDLLFQRWQQANEMKIIKRLNKTKAWTVDDNNKTWMEFALYNNEIDMAIALDQFHKYVSNDIYQNALYPFALHGNIKGCEFILSKNIDINLSDSNGHTALMKAIIGNQPKLIPYLVQQGAEPNKVVSYYKQSIQKHIGKSALSIAIELSRDDCFDVLLEHGASIALNKNINDYPLIFFCVANQSSVMIKKLLQSGLSLTDKDKEGSSLLHLLADFNNCHLIHFVLNSDPSLINDEDNYHKTPVMRAIMNDKVQAAKLLLPFVSDLHNVGSKRIDLLRLAIKHNAINCFNFLLKQITNRDYLLLALYDAIIKKYDEMILQLFEKIDPDTPLEHIKSVLKNKNLTQLQFAILIALRLNNIELIEGMLDYYQQCTVRQYFNSTIDIPLVDFMFEYTNQIDNPIIKQLLQPFLQPLIDKNQFEPKEINLQVSLVTLAMLMGHIKAANRLLQQSLISHKSSFFVGKTIYLSELDVASQLQLTDLLKNLLKKYSQQALAKQLLFKPAVTVTSNLNNDPYSTVTDFAKFRG